MLSEPLSPVLEPQTEPAPRIPSAFERKLGHHVDFSRAEHEAIDRLLARDVRTLKGRSVLVEDGGSPSQISVIVDGWACRYHTFPNGGRQIVAFYLPGDICDFDVFMMKGFDLSIAAIDNIRVAGINRAALSDLSKNHPRISRALWWESLGAAAIQRAWTINIGRNSAKQRVAHLLSELARRLEAVGLARNEQYELPLTQNDIADACAMTSVHINRTMQALRRMGFVDLQQKMLAITDRPGLHALAQFDPAYLQLGDIPVRAKKDVQLVPIS